MGNKYEIKVTRQALEQMREIAHYISYDLMAPEAADNLLDDLKANTGEGIPRHYLAKAVAQVVFLRAILYHVQKVKRLARGCIRLCQRDE